MRHWPGEWQAHTERERESYSVSAENATERVWEQQKQQQVKQLLSMLRAFPTRLKTRAYRFYFVVCFFSLIFLLSTLWILILFFATFARCNCFLSFAILSYAHWPTAFLNWGTNKIFAFFKAQNSPKNSCERCQSDFIYSILPRRISNALHSLFPKKQARLLRIALLQRLRRGSAAARGDGQVQRMARYSGTQVSPRGGGQPSTTLTTVCYSTNIYIFTLTRRHTHTRCEPKAHERRQTNWQNK